MKRFCVRLLWCGRILLAIAILFLLLKRLHHFLTAVEMESVTFEPFWLLGSLMLLLVHLGALGLTWFFLYQVGSGTSKKTSEDTHLTDKVQNPYLSGWVFFQLSQLGRYLPGKVGQFVVMFSLSNTFGIKKKGAVLATCCQLAFQCSVGCLIGFLVLRNTGVAPILHDLLADLQISGKTAFLIGSLAILTLGGGIIFFYRRRIRETFTDLMRQEFRTFFFSAGILRLISVYFLLWGLFGTAFFFFIKSLAPVSASQLLVVTGTYATAWSIGVLSVITPSGLGVREGILSLLLTSVLPPATATLIALLSRLWTISAELAMTGVASGLYWWKLRD